MLFWILVVVSLILASYGVVKVVRGFIYDDGDAIGMAMTIIALSSVPAVVAGDAWYGHVEDLSQYAAFTDKINEYEAAAKHKAVVLGLSVSTESGSRGPYVKKAEADLARVERRLETMKDQKARIAHDLEERSSGVMSGVLRVAGDFPDELETD